MKIFGIGLPRTGTTSLTEAMKILGYRAMHNPRNLSDIEENDFLCDGVIPACAYWLKDKYPGSKFIYTTRDEEKWHESCKKFYSKSMEKSGVMFWGSIGYSKGSFTASKTVFDQCQNFLEDLLTINICDNEDDMDKWETLCQFLGKKNPLVPFPHLNKGKEVNPIRDKNLEGHKRNFLC